MNEIVPVLKDEESQKPVPSVWRSTLAEIVESLREGDFSLEKRVPGVCKISKESSARIAANIETYGARLTSLPEASWQTSACQWMRGYWDVLVDLFTVEEGASDLSLAVRVYEDGSSFVFEVQSLHVP